MSSGGKPTCSTSRSYARPQISTRAGDVGRLALLVECHHDHAGAVVADPPRLAQELLLALLQRDRVDDALALQALEAGLEDRPLRAVDHDRQAGHLRLGRDHVQERPHRLFALEQVGVHVHVEQVGPTAHLFQRHVDGSREVARLDQPTEAGRAGHVGALADQYEARVGPELERLEPAEAGLPRGLGQDPRREPAHRVGDRMGVLGRRPAARADDVEEALLRELAEERRGDVRRLVVAAERVRQPRVRMARRQARRDPRQVGDVRAHLARAERAVDADDQRVRVLDRRPERLDRLAGQGTAREIDDRDADPERQLRSDLACSDDRRLRVQRVEDRLDQEQVDPAVGESANLLGVGLDHLIEGVRAEARVVDPRAEREGDVQRAERAGDIPAVRVGRLARDPGAGDIQVVDGGFEAVVGLTDRRRGERVRRRDVAAGCEIGVVHGADDVGARQVEDVRVVQQVARVRGEAIAAKIGLAEAAVLQQHAPGAVEHEDPLLGCLPDLCCDVSRHPRTFRLPKGVRKRLRSRGLFRRFLTRSPSCLQSFPGNTLEM